MKNNSYRPHFAAPGSSSTEPASSSVAPTSVGAPTIASQMTTNVDISDSKLWYDFITKAFIDIMVDEVTEGNMPSAWAKASLAKAERHRDRIVEVTSRVTSDCSLTKSVTILNEMEDIPHDAYGKALEKFMNHDWREVLIVMSVERKRGWVLRL
ncbi:hypothetical protein KIW84_054136 [Lathyrus oleraceus]|uniref:Uncharacterized protein n=1 Tax=Pisum sativum TaxID=3888 RepID=A0A9D4WSB1_PEA|nr:hypothetical protein KIW84_054136 [Pisum sativum]